MSTDKEERSQESALSEFLQNKIKIEKEINIPNLNTKN
jgi:hypothetical protein